MLASFAFPVLCLSVIDLNDQHLIQQGVELGNKVATWGDDDNDDWSWRRSPPRRRRAPPPPPPLPCSSESECRPGKCGLLRRDLTSTKVCCDSYYLYNDGGIDDDDDDGSHSVPQCKNLPDGYMCDRDFQCRSNQCFGQICRTLLPVAVGEKCFLDSQCSHGCAQHAEGDRHCCAAGTKYHRENYNAWNVAGDWCGQLRDGSGCSRVAGTQQCASGWCDPSTWTCAQPLGASPGGATITATGEQEARASSPDALTMRGCVGFALPTGIFSLMMCSGTDGRSSVTAAGGGSIQVSGEIRFPCSEPFECAPDQGIITISKTFGLNYDKKKIHTDTRDEFVKMDGTISGSIGMKKTSGHLVNVTIGASGSVEFKFGSLGASAEISGFLTATDFDYKTFSWKGLVVTIKLVATLSIGGWGWEFHVTLRSNGLWHIDVFPGQLVAYGHTNAGVNNNLGGGR